MVKVILFFFKFSMFFLDRERYMETQIHRHTHTQRQRERETERAHMSGEELRERRHRI